MVKPKPQKVNAKNVFYLHVLLTFFFYLSSSPFCDVIQQRLVASYHLLGHPVRPVLEGQAVQIGLLVPKRQ